MDRQKAETAPWCMTGTTRRIPKASTMGAAWRNHRAADRRGPQAVAILQPRVTAALHVNSRCATEEQDRPEPLWTSWSLTRADRYIRSSTQSSNISWIVLLQTRHHLLNQKVYDGLWQSAVDFESPASQVLCKAAIQSKERLCIVSIPLTIQ